MKNLFSLKYLLVATVTFVIACTSNSSTEGWANPNPDKETEIDPDIVPQTGDITSIQALNKSGSVAVNSHSEEWANSSIEMDYRRFTTVESPTLKAINAIYPRIKKMPNGSYLMIYQQGQVAWNVYYAYSTDLLTWQSSSMPLFESANAEQSSGTADKKCYSSCDAVVLSNGDVLAFVSYRLNNGYKLNLLDNGIVMKRSTDNGRTWSAPQVIYQGATWEPYALQLRSGELQLYFTDCDPNTGDSGTSLLRSADNGATWTTVGKVIRQKTGKAIDGSGAQIYSDQMPVAIELNNSESIVVATETRFRELGDIYNISMARSADNWASAPLVDDQEGPADRDLNFIEKAAAPYLRQFPSGETLLSYNANGLFTMQLGDSEAQAWAATYQPFEGKGFWGTMEIIDPHTVVSAMPETYKNDDNVDAARIQIGQFVLNHRINASELTPEIDAAYTDWKEVSDALFIGSESATQAAFRFAYDSDNLYCLVERLDESLNVADNTEIVFQGGDATGEPLKISLIPDIENNEIKCSHADVSCKTVIYGAFSGSTPDTGYIAEIAIPKSLLRVVGDRVLFNATLADQNGNDSFTGLTSTNYDKWLPIVLKAEVNDQPLPDGDNIASGTSWDNDQEQGDWK